MSIADYSPKQKCPSCKSSKYVCRDYQSDNVTGRVAIRTLGALADKNSDKLSDDEKQALYRKHNEYRFQPKPELPEGMKRINREKPLHDQPRVRRPKQSRNPN